MSGEWWLILAGLASVAFGVILLARPAAGALAVLSLIAAFSGGEKPVPTWWLIVVGLAGIAAGIVTFLWPGLTAIVLVYFIGGWAIAHGVFEIIGAIKLRKEIEGEWWLILAGLLSVVFGLIILVAPGAGALGLIWMIAAYSIAFGVILVALSFRLRSHRHA